LLLMVPVPLGVLLLLLLQLQLGGCFFCCRRTYARPPAVAAAHKRALPLLLLRICAPSLSLAPWFTCAHPALASLLFVALYL
jgi:hypothetical protein